MPRIREISIDNLKIKIGSLTMDEMEKFLAEGAEIRKNPSDEQWTERTLHYVALSMNKGDKAVEWTPTKVRSEFDMPTINFIFREFAVMSGLKLDQQPGEEKATSTSS